MRQAFRKERNGRAEQVQDPTHGIKMALINSDCVKMRSLRITWP